MMCILCNLFSQSNSTNIILYLFQLFGILPLFLCTFCVCFHIVKHLAFLYEGSYTQFIIIIHLIIIIAP